MVTKHDARLSYYQGARNALVEHMERTESGLRALEGLSGEQAEKMIAAVRKRHDKLMRRLEKFSAVDNAAAA